MSRKSRASEILHTTLKGMSTGEDITIDSVQAALKLSKGGVLYHFHNKDILFEKAFEIGLSPSIKREVQESILSIRKHGGIAMAFARYLLK